MHNRTRNRVAWSWFAADIHSLKRAPQYWKFLQPPAYSTAGVRKHPELVNIEPACKYEQHAVRQNLQGTGFLLAPTPASGERFEARS